MNKARKYGFTTLAYYLAFVALIYILDYWGPSSRYAPSAGILAIWCWCLYTLLMTFRNGVAFFLDKEKEVRISLIIHVFSILFLVGTSYYFGGLVNFLDSIT
jgi:hypothetical protein